MKIKKRQENIREYAGPKRGETGVPEKVARAKKVGASKNRSDKHQEREKAKHKEQTGLSKRVTRGATRSERRIEGKPIKWGRIILLPLLFVGFGLGVSKVDWSGVYNTAYASANRPLSHIKIESEFRYVSKQALQVIISEKLNGSFVDLDLRDIKASIEGNPWITEVMIERTWPDTLKLTIVEHKPIARWRDDGFISREGQLIKVSNNQVLSALPLLSGSVDDSLEVAKNYLVFSELLKSSQLRVSGLALDEKLAWTITLAQGFTLVLGRGDILGRLENFRYVYERHLKKDKNRLARIDMRYEQGLAVSWKDDELVAASAAQ